MTDKKTPNEFYLVEAEINVTKKNSCAEERQEYDLHLTHRV